MPGNPINGGVEDNEAIKDERGEEKAKIVTEYKNSEGGLRTKQENSFKMLTMSPAKDPEDNGAVREDQDEEKAKMLTDSEKFEEELRIMVRDMPLTEETTCGIWKFKGSMIQPLANKKTFALMYGLAGMFFASTYAYFNGTITTMEKRFKIPSRTSGVISIGNDITQLLVAPILSYYGAKGHRPRWISLGLFCVSTFCFLNALPHAIYGPGMDALLLTEEYANMTDGNLTNILDKPDPLAHTMCSSKNGAKCESAEGDTVIPAVIWFIAQLISGVGGTLYYSLGFSYMDDNIKKSKSPAIMSLSFFIRMIGPTIGFALVSIFLKMYIDPTLTPVIDDKDPRWLGAWWIGWIVCGLLIMLFGSLLCLLPKTLPRAAARKELMRQKSDQVMVNESDQPSFKDMMVTVKRLMSNHIYNYNQLSSIFYVFGYTPYWVFMPKYIETQYRVSASTASLVTGSVGLVFSALGVLVSGFVVQKYKPRAKYMAFWNLFIVLVSVCGIIAYPFLGCDAVDRQTMQSDDRLNASCSSSCNCDYVKFSPVCANDDIMGTPTMFISACHAGCTSHTLDSLGKTIYTNCSCISSLLVDEGGSASPGPCPVDCKYSFYIFLAIVCTLKLFGAMGRVTNVLVTLRCVDERDKSVSLGLGVSAISLFAFIPGPIFFGYLIDSTCVVWGKTCTKKGNCWLFDSALMRTRLNYVAAVFILIGATFDAAICYKIKDLNMFDDGPQTINKDEYQLSDKDKKAIVTTAAPQDSELDPLKV